MIAMGRKNEAEQVQESLIDNLLIHVQKRQIQEIDWSNTVSRFTQLSGLYQSSELINTHAQLETGFMCILYYLQFP